ncbi:MAG TPA: hypothetical protein VHA75_05365 [Rugosimonospora sp.]|nr:hypothetical protein [Rugosimonospora sp.]
MRTLLALLAAATTALPAVTASPSAPGAVTACTVRDARLAGLSGLAVTADGYVAVSDSNVDKSRIRIFWLDKRCGYVRSVGYPTSAYDPEDLAVGRDGTLYVADIGDNGRTRSSIAIWRLAPGSTRPQLFRYAYPDGAHDAEALLLAADDTPIVVTKDPLTAGIYVPTAPADPGGTPVPLRRAGTFTPQDTGTPNGLGIVGEYVVTGGANSPDRSRVALRTYAAAYEWAVPDGDVVKAITTGTPEVTPLPDEPQGESIAYTPDGRSLVTVSDVETDPPTAPILRYPAAPVATSAGTVPSPAGKAPTSKGATAGGVAPGGLRTGLLAVTGAAVVALAIALVIAALVRRRRPR